ncbi:glycosyltransferase family 2 protein [Janibacter cremeus]|uniref:glycosyltransferase family 2 protein n=1 Tax=Janibacter cremeus TaxID=1285192 RepID=UPI0023F69A29|nr:glycosyltransferase family 2 protein [Janibacter cremeus]WEV77666.1 glycosyltransferase family 2 protein [Janibacter cremeus]
MTVQNALKDGVAMAAALSHTPPSTSDRTQPRIAVVVLTQCTRPAELSRAIASVRAQRGVDPHLVLVVNGADPPDPDPSDRLIVLPDNAGIPGGRNLGVAATDAEVVFFLDDDAELQGEDHLASVLERFDEDPDLGAMAMRIVDETGRTQRRHVPRVGRRSAHRSGQVTHFIGAACAVRTSAFEGVGGFDPRFFYAMEESDLAWRLMDRGWSVWYSADLTAFHPHTAPSRHANHLRLQARNRLWMAWRSLPGPVFVAHMVTWTAVCAVRCQSLRDILTGYREAWAARPRRRPMRWRTVVTMTRLGRPPFV